MNFLLNRLDNLNIKNDSYEFIPADIKKEININGMLVGANGEFWVDGNDVMVLLRNSGLQEQIGVNMYNALMRKPMFIFRIPTQEDELGASKVELDNRYGVMAIHLNNFAQAFSIACWFIKDSCICATNLYWVNTFNGYNMQARRDMEVTLSDGTVSEIALSEAEVLEAISRMYEVLRYLTPDESKMGHVEQVVNEGTVTR